MGQGQSTSNGDSVGRTGPSKKCYYEVLEVEPHATDDELKKAYRRKALELHPDRNFGNTEDATKQFAEVQTAYEILSNPHERAWYDAHREEILHGVQLADDHYEHNVRMTTAEDITQMYMSFDGQAKFDDSKDGFYTVLRQFFDGLAHEEDLICQRDGEPSPIYPSFGSAKDDYDAVVRPFYSAWSSFSTCKTFSWKNIYRLSEAPDRRTRRYMEKENKKLREQGVRDFNAAVRALISFVKRRDPRYSPLSNAGSDLNEALRAKAANQAAQARAANQSAAEEYIAPVWAQTDEIDEEEISDDPELEEQLFECVICRKTFKSESQFEAHEKSKKHRKAVHDLERRLRKENESLGLRPISKSPTHIEDSSQQHPSSSTSLVSASDQEETSAPNEQIDSAAEHTEERRTGLPTRTKDEDPGHDEEGDDPYSDRPAMSIDEEQSLQTEGNGEDLATKVSPLSEGHDRGSVKSAPPIGKAKQRRAKKQAREINSEGLEDHRCVTCRAEFPSKNQLFKHINKEGHARPPSLSGAGKKTKR